MPLWKKVSASLLFPASVFISVAVVYSSAGAYGFLPPGLWEDAAVAFGIRPPCDATPLLWHRIVEYAALSYGPERALHAVMSAGGCAVGFLAAIVYFFFRVWMPVPVSDEDERWSRIVPAAGALLFAFSSPVWRAGRAFSPDVLNVTVFAAVLLVASYAFRVWLYTRELEASGETVPLPNRLWKLVPMCLFIAFILAAVSDVLFYSRHEGIGNGFGDLFVQLVRSCFRFLAFGFRSVADVGAFLAFVMLPVGFVFARLFFAYDRENPFSVADILLFAVVFVTGALQLGSFNGFEFSRLGANHMSEMSSFFACAGTLLSAFTTTVAIRVYVLRMPKKPFRIALPAVLVPAVLVTHLFSDRSKEREVASIVNDAIAAIAEECADCGTIITDGSLDAAIEVYSGIRGRKIKALSMMSGKTDYEKRIRLRGEQIRDDSNPLVRSTAEALKLLVERSSPALKSTAIQLGFELWREKNLQSLEFGGFSARTVRLPGEDVERFRANAVRIGENIIETGKKVESFDFLPLDLRMKFAFTQWRISRIARMRASAFEIAGDFSRAESDNLLADRLDGMNEEFRRLEARNESVSRGTDVVLTPQEGLSIGLSRADYAFARKYALQVLNSDPENVRANFAVGMDCFVKRQYSRAEKHLFACLRRSPRQAAVLNNLAVVQYRLGKFDEAENNAKKACELVPGSFEARETLRQIEKAVIKDRRKMVK